MSDVNAIATGLANRIGTTGLRPFANAPGAVSPPAVVVILNRPAITYGVTMDGEVNMNFLAIVLLSAANDTSGQVGLNAVISPSGSQSVLAAVQVDPTLGGTCEFAVVTQVATYGIVNYAGQDYIGASFVVEVGAHLL